MKLNEIFKAIAFKKLAMIDIPYLGSNQHEVQGIASVRKFFGTGELIRDEIQWHYFSDEEDVISDTGQITFYDARRMDPDRNAEWRMYYTGDFLAYAEPGDNLYLVRLNNGDVHGLIFQPDHLGREIQAYYSTDFTNTQLKNTLYLSKMRYLTKN